MGILLESKNVMIRSFLQEHIEVALMIVLVISQDGIAKQKLIGIKRLFALEIVETELSYKMKLVTMETISTGMDVQLIV